MKVYPSRDFIFFCCGLCVAFALGLGQWLYFAGWRHAVLPLSTPTQDAAIAERTKMRALRVAKEREESHRSEHLPR